MRETNMSKQDKEFKQLGDLVLKFIPHGAKNAPQWKRFRKYMDFYYKEHLSHEFMPKK